MLSRGDLGRGREHGDARAARLSENPKYNILRVEPLPAGVEKLKARGDAATPPDDAAGTGGCRSSWRSPTSSSSPSPPTSCPG